MSRANVREMYALHARLCKAIADPKRLLILDSLRDGERAVGDIAEELGLSQPNTSQHLAILRERNVVATSRSGNTIYYSLNSRKVIDAVDLLREFMAEFMVDGGADGQLAVDDSDTADDSDAATAVG
jgi:DNA-binding transcriptional ArsR family regulator